MLATILLKELAFSDSVRRLQQTGDHDTTYSAASSESDSNRGGIYISIVGLAIIVVSVAISCFAMIRILNNVDDLELLDDKSVHTTPKSTLAERKQAILDIFETSQVTMQVTEDNIHREKGCNEDIVESGFDDGGILKLSRLVAPFTSLNRMPAADAASAASLLHPPKWCCEVPNMCAICLDSYQPSQFIAWSPGCRHVFHQDCISDYLAKKMIGGETPCPSCRQKFCELPEEPLKSASVIDSQ